MVHIQIDAASGQSFTFSELRTCAVRFAKGLAKRGVRQGNRVCLYLTNCIELPIIWFALEMLGAPMVLGHAGMTAGQYIISKA